ncbi:MAG: CoA transferase [Micromonosporaceae bacterium]|nr:CoA transferase [Micromonosporaceae bacterium]
MTSHVTTEGGDVAPPRVPQPGSQATWRHNRLSAARVVDLTQVISGSVATMLMADFGAEVIKVEPPDGEPYRRYGTLVPGATGGENLNVMRFNRNKRSVCIDLKTAAGREVLGELVAAADVVVENFRPGVMQRLGFDFARLKELNPNVVYTTISGYGHDDLLPSPNTTDPAYAILTEANAGLLHLAGDPGGRPVWMGFAMSDIFSGVLAFAGTVMALGEVDNGRGPQRVDISMFDASLFMNDLPVNTFEVLGRVTGRGQYPLQAPWGPFPTADGYLAVAIMSEREWTALCVAVGRPGLASDDRLQTGEQRAANIDIIDKAVSGWLVDQSTEAAVANLQAAGVPCAPVNDAAGAARHPHTEAREMLVDVLHEDVGHTRVVGNPIKSSVPTRLREPSTIPRLGQDTRQVLREVLDRDSDAIDELVEKGVVRG